MGSLLDELSFGQIFALSVAGVAVLWMIGAVINALLQERGFGVIGNAFMLVIGGSIGFYMKILILGPISG